MKCKYDIFNVSPEKYSLLSHNLFWQSQIDYSDKLNKLKKNP